MKKMVYDLRIKLVKEGDMIYTIEDYRIKPHKIIKVRSDPYYVYEDEHGNTYNNMKLSETSWTSYDKAAKALSKTLRRKEKRRRMKEYEKELNKELHLDN